MPSYLIKFSQTPRLHEYMHVGVCVFVCVCMCVCVCVSGDMGHCYSFSQLRKLSLMEGEPSGLVSVYQRER